MSGFGERAFRLLLRLYPREFRLQYQEDLLAFFRQDRRHPRYGSGPLRPMRFWSATIRDLLRTAWSRGVRHDTPDVRRRWIPSPGASVRRLRADLRDARRGVWSAPGVTISALVVLTLGIGASTAIFSVVDAVALRGLPFHDATRLVSVAETNLLEGGRPVTAAPQNYAVWRARQDVFESLGAVAGGRRFTTLDLPIDNLRSVNVTASLFDVLRVAPAIGRAFRTSDEQRGAPDVAIISDDLWRRRFQARPDIVGHRLALETGTDPAVRADIEIVGVMPEGFTYPIGSALAGSVDLWVPIVLRAQDSVRTQGRTYNLSVVARLRPGETLERAAARMTLIRNSLATEYPTWFADRGIIVRRLQDAVVGGRVRDWMFFLLGAVGFVLLIACLNVANLLLARAIARGREVAVRSALGARRWDLSRALLVESLMLSVCGAAGGLLLAYWGVTVLRATLPQNLPRLATVAVDLRVLGVTAFASIVTGLLFGTLPALQLARGDVAGMLREGGRSQTDSAASGRLRTVLVTVEVATAVVLLAGAAMFLSSFMRVMRIDLGLDPEHVVAVSVAPPVINPDELAPRVPPEQRAKIDAAQSVTLAALERAKAVPGVVAMSVLTGGLPLSGNSMTLGVTVPGRPEPFTGDDEVWVHAVGAGYLDVVRATLVRGRWLADSDVLGSPAVVVLSQDAVRRYFGRRDPVGQVVSIDNFARTVIGVVGDMRLGGPEESVRPEAYVPYLQTDQRNADLVFRTGPGPSTVIPGVVSAIRSVAPKAAARPPETIARHFAGIVEQRKFNMIVLVLFGALAVVIASVGIYGLMAHLVAQRTREIGLRIALGAVPSGILQMVLRRALVLMLGGVTAGLVIAAALERLIRVFLFQATPYDPRIYGAVGVVLVAAGLLAAFGPARRAARVDPLVALRSE